MSAADDELAHSRAEVDRLRRENQALYGRLETLREPRELLRAGLAATRTSVRSATRTAKAWRRPGPGTAASAAVAPYEAHVRLEPVAGRPRVLHVIANFYTGGSAQLVVDLFERLGHSYEQTVVARDLPPTPAYTGVPVLSGADVATAGRAAATIRRMAPDLAHVHFLGHHRTPYSEQDWRWYHRFFRALEGTRIPVIENVNIPVEPYVSDCVVRYVYVSDYIRRRHGFADADAVVVHPGSDLSLFHRAVAERVPEDCIGMVYRLERDKLDETAIAPLLEVLRRRPQTRAIVVGDGGLRPGYEAAARTSGVAERCTFAGYVPYRALPEWYRKLSLFVAPVHRESFGQVTPFAMGMRLPVAGYRVGALEEILGDSSTLVPTGDVSALADVIVELLDDGAQRRLLGDANAARAHDRFSVEAMVAAYDRLYCEALGLS